MLLLACSLSLSIYPSIKVSAQGNLMVMPKRVVFDGSKKTHELNLANTGQDSAKYVISLVHYKMKEDGSFVEMGATDTSENFADKYIRFFPRSVVLGPNESQTVRIQLKQTSKLLPGEYRSHLYFRAIADEKPLGVEETNRHDSSAVSVRLIPVFGISLPVIIRVGQCSAQVNISSCSLEMYDDNTPLLSMTFNREGNMSVYGDITVEHISLNDKVTKVGSIQGLAVYTHNRARRIKIALDKNARVDYSKGKLYIVYKTQSDIEPVTLAQTQLLINYNPLEK
ncbi:hypothetical protein A4R26_31980 [Niastella populi]|uniref:Molecular chaperone n=1 Tax=Niastella populi TaxID=550983 RepID=A0A1V9EKP1_9BACT|nr:hypothetical protein A4R26_31980 [Niastella populi]